jgi:dynein heavy chain
MILKLLYEAKGDLLNDEVLIDALKISKEESSKVEEKISKLEADQEVYDSIRMQYKDVGKRIASLFFIVLNLAQIEATYYWSLAFYI